MHEFLTNPALGPILADGNIVMSLSKRVRRGEGPTARRQPNASSVHKAPTRKARRPQIPPVLALRQEFGLSRKLFSRLANYSERAIAGWEAGGPLTVAGRKRMVELKRLQQGLAGVMQSDFVGPWLDTPNAAFTGLKPLEVIERGETDRIWRMIYELESGAPA